MTTLCDIDFRRLEKVRVATVVRLLGEYQGLLESTIETALIPGSNKAMCREDARVVAQSRRRWNEAEAVVAALTEKPRKARTPK